jgi:8-oxo-dGTP diphosphatase
MLDDEKTSLTVCLIGITDGNKILLVKRKRDPYYGYWGLLGGRPIFGEKVYEVAKREVMEETGFSIKNNMTINGTYSEILLNGKNEPKEHFLFVTIKAELNKNLERKKETEDTDIEDFKWFDLPINEKNAKKIIPTDLIMLNNFNSNKLIFKEFVMKENGNELKIVDVI